MCVCTKSNNIVANANDSALEQIFVSDPLERSGLDRPLNQCNMEQSSTPTGLQVTVETESVARDGPKTPQVAYL